MTNWHQRALTNINKRTYGDLLLLVPKLYFNKAFQSCLKYLNYPYLLLIIFYCTTTGHNTAAQQQCQRTHVPFQRAPGSDNTTTTFHTSWLPSQPQTALPLMADPSELLVVETNAEATVTHLRMVAIKKWQ